MNKSHQQLQQSLQPNQCLLLANIHDIRYLSGFISLVPEEREAFIVVCPNNLYLLYATFTPLPKKNNEFTTLPHTSPLFLKKNIQKILDENTAIEQILIDEPSLFVDEYKVLQEIPNLKLISWKRDTLQKMRAVKNKDEIRLITKASQIATQALNKIHEIISPGISELEIKTALERAMEDLGSEKPAFPTIVAFGPHIALPHHQPTHTKLLNNVPILIDFGVTIGGYRSDMTRTWWIGDKPDQEFNKIESIVHQAYQAAVIKLEKEKKAIANKTLLAKDVDAAARHVIDQAGYGKYFIHTTGHGIGLDIHEPPSLNWRNTQPIEAGMAITIEPGIYLDGKFGYRYENTIIVK